MKLLLGTEMMQNQTISLVSKFLGKLVTHTLLRFVKTLCRPIVYKSYCIIKYSCEHFNLGEITVFLSNSWKRRRDLEARKKK